MLCVQHQYTYIHIIYKVQVDIYIFVWVSLFQRVVLSMRPEQQICSFKFYGVINFFICIRVA